MPYRAIPSDLFSGNAVKAANLEPAPGAAAPDVSEAAKPAAFVASGDNFRTVGPWRLVVGRGWRRWQKAALTAELAASRSFGDVLTEARQLRGWQARGHEWASDPADDRE